MLPPGYELETSRTALRSSHKRPSALGAVRFSEYRQPVRHLSLSGTNAPLTTWKVCATTFGISTPAFGGGSFHSTSGSMHSRRPEAKLRYMNNNLAALAIDTASLLSTRVWEIVQGLALFSSLKAQSQSHLGPEPVRHDRDIATDASMGTDMRTLVSFLASWLPYDLLER